ncbi:MAG: hypothetical protein IKQ46_12710 [Bacteroidales bacterium]|jgi:hypothetical protein|nr:hypothetical protein [Bacteroidales bacterium]
MKKLFFVAGVSAMMALASCAGNGSNNNTVNADSTKADTAKVEATVAPAEDTTAKAEAPSASVEGEQVDSTAAVNNAQ